MISGFILKKIGSTRLFDSKGQIRAGTLCYTPTLTLTQVKNQEIDNYNSLQFAYGQKKNLDKPTTSKLKKNKLKIKPQGFVEFTPNKDTDLKVGQFLNFDQVFSVSDKVNATGTSKGRGFAGAIKRHGFHRQPVTMGASDRTRSTGAIGAQTPGKVVKGKKMPGHFGNTTITVKNLEVLSIDNDKKQVIISGSIPGPINSWFVIKRPKY